MKDLIFRSETIQDTEEFAHLVASLIKKHDLILLKGELGSGKTTFARSIINSKYFANDINHVVPSPTFNLLQTYEFGDRTIGHADLYRIQNKEEIAELDHFMNFLRDVVNDEDYALGLEIQRGFDSNSKENVIF